MAWAAIAGVAGSLLSNYLSSKAEADSSKTTFTDPRSASAKNTLEELLGMSGGMRAGIVPDWMKTLTLSEMLGSANDQYRVNTDYINKLGLDARSSRALMSQATRDKAKLIGQGYKGLQDLRLSERDKGINLGLSASTWTPGQTVNNVVDPSKVGQANMWGNLSSILGAYGGKKYADSLNESNNPYAINYSNNSYNLA